MANTTSNTTESSDKSNLEDFHLRETGRQGIPMETMPGSKMYYNDQVGMRGAIIVTHDGSTINFGGEPAIKKFVSDNKLTTLEIKTLNAFNALAEREIQKSKEDYKMTNKEESALDKNAPKADLIGSKMPVAEWQEAIKLVGGKSGHIYIPKQNGQYSGKIILVSDTHLVQQVGKNIAIAHEISKLANKSEIDAMADIGKLQNKNFDIKYNDKVGEALPISFNERRAGEVKEKAFDWAEKNISDTKSRDVFLKHIEAFAKKLAEPSFAKVAKETAAPSVPTPSNQHTQKR